MRRFFIKNNQIKDNIIHIIGEDVNHIKNVLRLEIGEQIEVLDENNLYVAEIIEESKDEILLNIIEKSKCKDTNVKITIFQGLPKSDKMELIIQKGTELGVKNFIPVSMERCIVKLDKKEESKKIERWQKIAETAAKQCKRNDIPLIQNVQTVKDICNSINDFDIVILAYEEENVNLFKNEIDKIKILNGSYNVAVVIGPEGGIERKEAEELKKSGAKVVSLGKRILRTETVALYVSSIIMYELEKN